MRRAHPRFRRPPAAPPTSRPFEKTCRDALRKVRGQRRRDLFDHLGRTRDEALDERPGVRPAVTEPGGGVEMGALHVAHPVVARLAPHGHGQRRLAPGPLVAGVALHGPDRHHVIERRELEAAARQQPQAEVLRVAVRRREHPEGDLRAETGFDVLVRTLRLAQDTRDLPHPGATLRFVLEMRRHAGRQAEVLLGQTQQRAGARPGPVESLHAQHFLRFLRTEDLDPCRRNGQPIGLQHREAAPFVFDGGLEIHLPVPIRPSGISATSIKMKYRCREYCFGPARQAKPAS